MAELSRHETPTLQKSTASAGVLLVVASLLEIAAMAHHPSVRTSDIAQAIEQIGRLSYLAAVVHGVLVGLMLVIVYGLSELAILRGPRRPLIRAGSIAYIAGVVVMINAALVSGWITADLASLTPHSTELDRQINAQLLTLCGVVNHACANFAVVAMSAGIGLWSADLLHDKGVQRMAGLLGLVIGLGLIGAMLSGILHLDVPGMSEVVILQAVWTVAVGVMLVTYRGAPHQE